jgi:ribonuclease HI
MSEPGGPPGARPSGRGPASGPLHLVIRADGAARGNPGPAACGAILVDASMPGAREADPRPLAVIARPLGRQTNNIAEYAGVLLALRRAVELGAEEVELLLDSNLVVEQLNGRWKVRDAKLRPLHEEASRLLGRFRRWTATHVRREGNRAADALANLALDDPAAAAEAERRIGAGEGGPPRALPGQERLFDG